MARPGRRDRHGSELKAPPSHLHIIAEGTGHVPLVTEIFPTEDPYLDRDAVFGVRADLLMEYRRGNERTVLPESLLRRAALPDDFWRVDLHLRMAVDG